MQIEEAKKVLGYQLNMKDTDVYAPINYEAIDTVLNELEKKYKVIDLLADDLRYYEGMQQDQLFCIDTCEGKMCDEEHCKERIKEYFYKKVRNGK